MNSTTLLFPSTRRRYRLAALRPAMPAGPFVHDVNVLIPPSLALGDRRHPLRFRTLWAVLLVAVAAHLALIHALHAARSHAPHTPVKLPPVRIELVTPPKPLPEAPTPPPPSPAPAKTPPRVTHAAPMARAVRPPPVAAPRPARPELPATPSDVPLAPAPTAVPAPPAAPAPAALAPAPAEAKVVPPNGSAAYLHNPPPDYPPMARDQGWEGHVVLSVHVLANGHPDSVEVRTSSGRKVLDRAAVNAVTNWIFAPARRGDTPIDGWVDVPLDFKLG
ncbi:hypothetical protein DR64_8204 [Paraburkholderia xenovorans LB400]|uniref:Outer membrane transport energization protein TonB n=1 Tax=Paraburkholderia xenovorans (strain LB400) TaxID=266265 RepID=Q13ID8_PARXL|nr:energy transducer TonB [Paraburkholderia xenovorans]ABE36151.1 outer membrane transport energization protein TonB [Paraburkholderia xenovorans LB400]AIP34495.1 hypothetical protein DR64_8204 [Paraburkholderia xenovorans LB400]